VNPLIAQSALKKEDGVVGGFVVAGEQKATSRVGPHFCFAKNGGGAVHGQTGSTTKKTKKSGHIELPL